MLPLTRGNPATLPLNGSGTQASVIHATAPLGSVIGRGVEPVTSADPSVILKGKVSVVQWVKGGLFLLQNMKKCASAFALVSHLFTVRTLI